jgi:hypothetical protein
MRIFPGIAGVSTGVFDCLSSLSVRPSPCTGKVTVKTTRTRSILIAASLALAMAGATTSAYAADDSSATTAAATDSTPAIVEAADAFLATLSDDEKAAVLFDWSDTDQKTRWSNLPQGLYTREGLMWGDMGDEAQTAWLAVMRATLSEEGYERVRAEWRADDELAGSGVCCYGQEYYWVLGPRGCADGRRSAGSRTPCSP